MNEENSPQWHFSRQMNISSVVQIILLASLIIGTWVNLQQQLGQLSNDVTMLLRKQEKIDNRMESLGEKCIGYEYRISGLERQVEKQDNRGITIGFPVLFAETN